MNILLTKKLSQEHLDLIKSWGWSYDIVEALKISPVEIEEIPARAEAWIVSSRNSMHAVKKFIDKASFIYCIGDWIKKEIEKLGVKITVKDFENMKSLASDLSEQNLRNVIYFCGDEHRNELKEGLKNTETKISKVVTHQSAMTFPVIRKEFDAVFVFSPRSAESLLKHNQFSGKTIFGCIGSTTAEYLNSRGISNTFAPSYPDSKKLLEELNRTLNFKH
ncbi:MAG: uroporphyrinogen-III synthase [Bacteroidetes bacterium]|nr:uroporphyrinogen-III synthase [Bacteroidota bacterium]